MLPISIMAKSSSFILIISILSCVISTTVSQFKPRQRANDYIKGSDSTHFMKSTKLNDLVFNLAKDERSNELFVGGRNHIYKLDPNELKVIQNTTTGPAEHHVDCKPSPETCHLNRTKQDNDNKILLVMDKKQYSKVLSCGTIHQGMCYLHQKNALDTKRIFGSPASINNFLVSSKSVVGFLANVPYENESVIFIGNQYDGRNLSLAPSLLSSKKLIVKTGVGFEHTHEDANRKTSVDIDPTRKGGHPVTFIAGFSDETYAYFVTTSPVIYGSADYETRISRVCLKDKSFKSFSEIPIACEDLEMTYNIATSAYIGSSTSSQIKNDVLYINFMHAPSRRGPDVDQNIGSAICAFPMSDISEKFYEAAKECSVGSENAKVSTLYIGSRINSKCSIDPDFSDESLCHTSRNYYIEGNLAVVASPLIKFPATKVSSLTTTISQPGSTAAAVIAIVGTSTGEILKVLLQSQRITSNPVSDDKRILYRGSVHGSVSKPKKSDRTEILPSTVFDANMDNLFFLSGSSIFKFPVKSCSIYETCGSCLSTIDPLDCGWCNGKCGHAKECPREFPPDRSTCTPVIYDFMPKKGPTHGGTPITIYGDNFGSLISGEHNVKTQVLLGSDVCEIITSDIGRIVCHTKKSMNQMEVKLRIDVNDTTKTSVDFNIQGSVTAIDNFEFVDPVITGLSPNFGPRSGGTNLTIMGQHLDAGATRKILIGSSSCEENSNNGRNITCLTGGMGKKTDAGTQRVQIHFDGFRINSPENFTYKSNPELIDVHPKSTFVAGGVTIYIEGNNLDSLSNPKMSVQIHQNTPKVTECTVLNSTVMTCIAPPLWKNLAPEKEPVITNLSFSMDGQTISAQQFTLKYFPNPSVYPFTEDVRPIYLEEPIIEVIGSNLRPDFEMSISAGVDNIPCKLLDTSITGVIKCQLLLENVNQKPNVGDALEVHYTLGQMSGSLGSVEFVKKPGPSKSTFIIVTVIFLVLLVLVAVVFVCLKKQGVIMKKKKRPSFTVEYRPEGPLENDYGQNARNGGESAIPLIAGSRVFHVDDETMAILTGEKKLIAREYLTIGDVVGKGHFGCVCEGNLFDPEHEQTLQVAIKTLQASSISSNKDVEMFVKEALIMKDFNHKNVLNLVGVTFSQEDNLPLVIIPFMKNGDLLSFIRDESNDPTVKDLITFAVEIAEGMDYLASQKCVHRDLAARNCMLDENRHVKVADFGLSRDVYEQEYYKSAKMAELPVKWMAPESLEKGSYSSKSDVWSYGVTVWELMTRGIPPYPQVNSWEIGSYIRAGHRLPQTDCCPNQLYDIMLSCWLFDPKQRPTFSQLVRDVQNVITTLENYSRSRVVTKDITYINFPPTSIYANEFESEVLNAVAPIMEGAVGGRDVDDDQDTSKIIEVMKKKKLSSEFSAESWC